MQEKARKMVMDYFNKYVERHDNKQITMDDVHVVWFSEILYNWKAMVRISVYDDMCFKVTHDGYKNETYLDTYKKWDIMAIED